MLEPDASDPSVFAPVRSIADLGTMELAMIDAVIAAARPAIQRDGGDIELAGIVGDVVRIRLTGACTHCAQAGQTLGGIRREIMRTTGLPLRVLPAPCD